jgi:hypothetical protein
MGANDVIQDPEGFYFRRVHLLISSIYLILEPFRYA